MKHEKPQVLVCQHGARRRYAIPRMLERAGMLAALYTDSSSESFFGKCAGRLGSVAPASFRRLANRKPYGIPINRNFSSDCCIILELRKQLAISPDKTNLVQSRYQRLSRKMMRWGLRNADFVYSMYDENLDFVRWAKEQGARSLVDVFISPATSRVMAEESELFPDWGVCNPNEDIDLADRLWKEVSDLADILICPSTWVAKGICEITPEAASKVRIVPYGCSIDFRGHVNQPIKGRVLFAGGNALRKGLRYLAEAATQLRSSIPELDVRIAGSLPLEIVDHPICKDLNFLGKLTSEQIKDEYLTADLFVLPSLSEGFAGVVAESIGAGCPVVVTEETGSPVIHEKEGLVVPSRDVEALANAIERIIMDRNLRKKLSSECCRLVGFYSEREWQRRLTHVICEDWKEGEGRDKTEHTKCRVIVQQPALRRYRIPFYREWAKRAGISLKLLHAVQGDNVGNIDGDFLEAECIPMWTRKIGHRSFMWHSAQWMGAEQGMCDVLVLSWNTQYISLIPSLLRARKNGIRTILWGHGFSKDESWLRRFIRNAIGRLADALVFYDFSTAQNFLDAGWPEERIHVAPNSLDQMEIQTTRMSWLSQPSRLESFQQENGLAGRKNIIYVGRIYKENRLDILIKALPEIKNRHPQLQLLVIGKVNELTKQLQQLAENLGVAPTIKWLGEIYEENEIAPYMLSSQLFCYPANIGLSIMHAMGYELPVVAGDHIPSHNPEIQVLRDGVNGSLFRHLDTEDLSVTLSDLLDDPERVSSMGSAARDSVLNQFTTKKMVDGFMLAIKSVGKG
jgi:glycosyltransferase involved in cell wall biosynthesis